MDARGSELEAHQPFAGDAAGAHFRRSEFPSTEGFLRGVREELAGTRILEVGGRHIARCVDFGAQGDAHFAVNRGERFARNVRQDLVEHFAFCGTGG